MGNSFSQCDHGNQEESCGLCNMEETEIEIDTNPDHEFKRGKIVFTAENQPLMVGDLPRFFGKSMRKGIDRMSSQQLIDFAIFRESTKVINDSVHEPQRVDSILKYSKVEKQQSGGSSANFVLKHESE